MAFANGWLNRQGFHQEPLGQLPRVSPRHGQTDTPDPSAYTWEAPAAAETAETNEYPGSEWVVNTGGLVLDQTPTDHDDGLAPKSRPARGAGPAGQGGEELRLVEDTMAAHQRDQGATRRTTYAPPPLQFASEEYGGARFDGFGPVPVSDDARRRGLNGDEVNNPPLESYQGRGYRWGWVEQQWVDRKFFVGERVHDARVVMSNLATVADDQPPPAKGNPYTSPFRSLAKGVTRTWQTPMQRREPPTISESIVVDGSEAAPSPIVGDWVVG